LLSTLFGTGSPLLSPLLGIDGHGAHRRRRRLGPLVQESVTRGRSVTDAEGEVVAAARAVPTRVTRTELCSRTWQSTVARMRGTRWSTMVRMRGDAAEHGLVVPDAVEHNSDDVRGTPMPPSFAETLDARASRATGGGVSGDGEGSTACSGLGEPVSEPVGVGSVMKIGAGAVWHAMKMSSASAMELLSASVRLSR
jgi:hypothetical protein